MFTRLNAQVFSPSKASFPWQEDVGRETTRSVTGGELHEGSVVEPWLQALARGFGTCVRVISSGSELTISGGGTVCRRLDVLCGRRPLCLEAHRALHAITAESGRTQRIRCPVGFLIVSVPIQATESRLGQIEFGPVGVGQVDYPEFERGLCRLGISPTKRSKLQTPIGALRIIRAEDVEGVLTLLERVAAVVAAEMARISVRTDAKQPTAVTAGRRFAEQNLGQKITLAETARHVALSPDHFSKLFRRTMGISFGDYVNRCRVANAQRMLASSSQRIAEICYACGFDSVPHFNRVFRRVVGTTPSLCRKQIGSPECPGSPSPCLMQSGK